MAKLGYEPQPKSHYALFLVHALATEFHESAWLLNQQEVSAH